MKFIGRKQELEDLSWYLEKRSASMIVVKGRRRIGKTRLIQEFSKNYSFFPFSGLAPTQEITTKDQKQNFINTFKELFGIPLEAEDWFHLFRALARMTAKGRVIILLDEISWLAAQDYTFLPKLKDAWDMHFSKNPKLILFLCGSISSWIDKNILSSTGFVGRISYTLTLKELPINEIALFWEPYRERYSAYEICKVASVTGGVPLYLENVDPKQPAEENILKLCFRPGGLLVDEFEKIFSDLFSKRSTVYRDIVFSLIDGPKMVDEIRGSIGYSLSGKLFDHIYHLELAGFVQREYTWDIKSKSKSKLSRVRLTDNYIRFYLKYILPNKDKIEKNEYTLGNISSLSQWWAILGLQFECLVLNNRRKILEALKIDPFDIVFDNPYFQKKSKNIQGCQIDYLVQTKYNNLFICEIKFSKDIIGMSVIDEVKQKISTMTIPKNYSYRPVLIHINGVSDDVMIQEYFSNIINFGDFLKEGKQ